MSDEIEQTPDALAEAADSSAGEEQPKPKRAPRARKPKAEKADADSETKAEEPVAEEKPKPARKPRAARPKAPAAEAAEEPKAEAEAEATEAAEAPKAEKAAPAAKPKAAPKRGAAKQPEKPKAAPRSRRGRREPQEPVAAPVVRAQAKYVRSSARKARLVCDNIRGRSVTDARAILAHTPRAVARDWSKLLESAIANAENNHDLDGEDLVIKAVHADEGPTIKRFRPRAMGRATQIRKRTAHLTILLTPKN
jgi:ribosomal protein L22